METFILILSIALGYVSGLIPSLGVMIILPLTVIGLCFSMYLRNKILKDESVPLEERIKESNQVSYSDKTYFIGFIIGMTIGFLTR